MYLYAVGTPKQPELLAYTTRLKRPSYVGRTGTTIVGRKSDVREPVHFTFAKPTQPILHASVTQRTETRGMRQLYSKNHGLRWVRSVWVEFSEICVG